METTTKQFTKGQRVAVDPDFPGAARDVLGRTFVVQKVNPRNVQCTAEDGGRGINYPKESLVALADGEQAPGLTPRPYVPREFFTCGEIVTLNRPFKHWTTDQPMVVLADKGNRVNVTPLGGDADRYVRVPPAGLTKRSVEWLAERLVDMA